MSTAIVWFRRDLRLDDNPALHAALTAGHRVLPVYIHAPREEAPWSPGAASRSWLHHSLAALAGDLRERGSGLLIRTGSSGAELEALIAASGAEAVYWNRLYEPAAIARDAEIKRSLRAQGVRVDSYNAALLAEPWQLETGQGDPYKVFTPFWKKLRARLTETPSLLLSLPVPARLPTPPSLASVPLADLDLRPKRPWDTGFYPYWQPGEAGAQIRLAEFVHAGVDGYRTQRDRPDNDGTSRLSPHLHFGEISPRRLYARLQDVLAEQPAAGADAEGYQRELGWREFSHHLLYHFPYTAQEPLNPRFRDFPWADDPTALRAWQSGHTGIPIVDAGMRQLWHSGWMHNRVRMIVASVLTKNLRLHWLAGARWFWDTLVDADLANNSLGWQWSAGCGADAAPYFRIFNPVSQSLRFDPDGRYLATWLPELAALAMPWRAQPWIAPQAALDSAGLARDSVYRRPIVDLQASRAAALAAYQGSRGQAPNSRRT